MKTFLKLTLAVACLASAVATQAQGTNISSYPRTNALAKYDLVPFSATNRASGSRTRTIYASNALPALLSLGSGTTANDATLARQTNASGLVIAPVANTEATNSHLGFAVSTNVIWRAGVGSPESAITAAPGSIYSRIDGGGGTSLYVKTNGVGNTGWWGVQ